MDTNLEEACKCECTHVHPPIRPHTRKFPSIFILFCSAIILHCLHYTVLSFKGSLKNNNIPSILVCFSSQTTAPLCLSFQLYEMGYSSCSFVRYLLPKISETEWRGSHRAFYKRRELSHKQLCSACHNFVESLELAMAMLCCAACCETDTVQ